jgi:hypothetical protein
MEKPKGTDISARETTVYEKTCSQFNLLKGIVHYLAQPVEG